MSLKRSWGLMVALASLSVVACGGDDDDHGTGNTGGGGEGGADTTTGGAAADTGGGTSEAGQSSGGGAGDGGADSANGGSAGSDNAMGGAGGDSATGGNAGAATGGSAGSDNAMGGAGGGAGSDPGTGGADGGHGGAMGPTTFAVRVENLSGESPLPSPLAPGVYAVHEVADPLFTSGSSDAGDGLEALAEDGDPSTLATSLESAGGVAASGVFDTPAGATSAGPAVPGDAWEFLVTASPGAQLSFATMLVQSNDLFLGPDGMGIALFDGGGMPRSGDVTAQIGLWDAGTERNEAPRMGPSQPAIGGGDFGPSEGVVSRRIDTTRAIPLPNRLVHVTVTESGGTYTIGLTNTSAAGPLTTPIAPVAYTLHDSDTPLFTAGSLASAGLELLAEAGDPSVLVTEAAAAGATAAAAGSGPAGPTETFQFEVTPTMSQPLLSLAMMIVHSNDVFIATRPAGVALLDGSGDPRPASMVEADLARSLAVWDAGTEANEVPGVGPNQPLQGGGATGPADPDDTVRLYADPTNDLASASVGGMVALTITNAGGLDFDVTLENTSGASPYPLLLTPALWAVHDAATPFFTMGQAAAPDLEHLAEDGDPTSWLATLSATSGVAASGVEGAAPSAPGEAFSFQVTMTPSARFLSIASMVVPSNDTFVALGDGAGIELVTTAGAARSDADIAADVSALLRAYESGTEANEAGATGPFMAPHQPGANMGASEGDATVRPVNDQWGYPEISQLVRVTVTPQ